MDPRMMEMMMMQGGMGGMPGMPGMQGMPGQGKKEEESEEDKVSPWDSAKSLKVSFDIEFVASNINGIKFLSTLTDGPGFFPYRIFINQKPLSRETSISERLYLIMPGLTSIKTNNYNGEDQVDEYR